MYFGFGLFFLKAHIKKRTSKKIRINHCWWTGVLRKPTFRKMDLSNATEPSSQVNSRLSLKRFNTLFTMCYLVFYRVLIRRTISHGRVRSRLITFQFWWRECHFTRMSTETEQNCWQRCILFFKIYKKNGYSLLACPNNNTTVLLIQILYY